MKIVKSKEISSPLTAQPLLTSSLIVKEIIIRTEVGEVAVGDEDVTYLTGARVEKDGSRTFSSIDLGLKELDLSKVYIVGTVPAAKVHWWALD